MKLVSIDPSINTPGFSYFEDSIFRGSETYNVPQHKELRIRLGALAMGAKERVQLFQPGIVLIEWADKWTRGGKNIAALQLLALATGVIFQAVFSNSDAIIHFVSVQDWKIRGREKSKQKSSWIRKEMELLFNVNFPSEHCSDAAGMAHWWMSQERLRGLTFLGKEN